jgi:GNAT superfamily N-acetyltransferase
MPGWNWDVRRWDGSRFHAERPLDDQAFATTVGIWEDRTGRLVGAVHPDGDGEAVLELRPDWRQIEPAMIEWACTNLGAAGAGADVGSVTFEVADSDGRRRELLVRSGGHELEPGGWRRRRRLDGPAIVVPTLADGYAMRATLTSDDDCGHMAALLNASFGRNIHTGGEYRTFVERSPSFRHDLNLVAVGPDGTFAAHVGVTLEPSTHHATVEPVCTHPDHRRLGLARVLLLEGLRRATALGARTASVDTGEVRPANALYEACGFVEAEHLRRWRIAPVRGVAREA